MIISSFVIFESSIQNLPLCQSISITPSSTATGVQVWQMTAG